MPDDARRRAFARASVCARAATRPLGSGVGGHAPAELGLGLTLDVRAHALYGFEWEGESLHGEP